MWLKVAGVAGGKPKNYRNLEMAIGFAALSSTFHLIFEIGDFLVPWTRAAYYLTLVMATTFWISATFDIADGEI